MIDLRDAVDHNQEAGGLYNNDRHGILRSSHRVSSGSPSVKKVAVVPSQYDLLYQDAMQRIVRHKRI
jgi:hypothetical protein